MLNRKAILFIVSVILVAILVGNLCYKNCCKGLKKEYLDNF